MENLINSFKQLNTNESVNFQEIINSVKQLMDKYIDDPSVEIEGRLGIYDADEKKFDSNIGEEYYKIINELLVSAKNEYWRKNNTTVETDYYYKNMRLTIGDNGNQRCITKEKLESLSFVINGGILDFRVSASKETPIDTSDFPVKTKCKHVRQKQRQHFNYKMWNFELTEVNSVENDESVISFEYEIELNKTDCNTKDTKYLSHSLVLKLLDAINACKKIEKENTFFIVK